MAIFDLISDFFAPASRSEKYDPLSNKSSIEFSFRARRFTHIQQLIETVLEEKGECAILDVGGTEKYWRVGGDFIRRNRHRLHITLVNLEAEQINDRVLFESIGGDATDQQLCGDRRFDLVHSNSVIEHVGRDRMMAFADNVRRLAPRYFVQTPNYWFPFEPHFRLPAFQYLPAFLRVAIIRRFAVGFFDKVPDRDEAKTVIKHHDMIGARQMRRFFPDGEVQFERFAGLNKSVMAIRAKPAEMDISAGDMTLSAPALAVADDLVQVPARLEVAA